MATASGNMKGFYRQKKGTKASKSSSSSSSSKKSTATKKSPRHAAASIGSDVSQPTALISHGSFDLQDDYDKNEEVLRQFDMNMAYGPCLGMTRVERFDRAQKMGLNPPREVGELLKGEQKVRLECLWDGLV